MTALIIILIVIGVLLLAFLGLIIFVATLTTHPQTTPLYKGWENEMGKDFMKGLDMTPSSVYTIMSLGDYILHAEFLPAYDNIDDYGLIEDFDYHEPSNHFLSAGNFAPKEYRNAGVDGKDDCNGQKFVIISHGYTYNRYGSLKYASIFRKHGYNVVIYDNRRHGENKKCLTTFGREESKDLMAVIEDTRNRFGKDIALGCAGESMGTGLSITALQYNPDIDFILADCGYADLANVIRAGLRTKFHLPEFLGSLGGAMSGLLYGYNYMKTAPINLMGDGSVPICFAHGGDDDFITPDNSKRMHDAYTGYSEYHEYPGAWHGVSLDSDPERYEKMVVDFLDKVYSGQAVVK